MPKGSAAAKKAGEFSGGGNGFVQRPKGVRYFSLKNDQEEAVVRFLTQAEDIEWVRQWKLAPSPGFRYGEKIPCVDQHEDGTPDPGYAAGLKNSWSGYAPLIYRNAPQFAVDQAGKLIKDGNDNKQLIGYADDIFVWEHSYKIYTVLQEFEANYRGLMSRDVKIKRIGAAGSNTTTYMIVPYPIDAPPSPLSQQDTLLIQQKMPDLRAYTRVPTYEELYNYLATGAVPGSEGSQAPVPGAPQPQPSVPMQGGLPVGMPQQQGIPQPQMQPPPLPPAPPTHEPPAWPAQQQPGGMMPMPPAPPAPMPAQPVPGFNPVPPAAPAPQPPAQFQPYEQPVPQQGPPPIPQAPIAPPFDASQYAQQPQPPQMQPPAPPQPQMAPPEPPPQQQYQQPAPVQGGFVPAGQPQMQPPPQQQPQQGYPPQQMQGLPQPQVVPPQPPYQPPAPQPGAPAFPQQPDPSPQNPFLR